MPERPELLIVLGPTASGKERTAFRAARELDAEIVSVDSMKIYRQLDIGTAKASPEMRKEIPHHCLDIASPYEAYSAASFVAEADRAIDSIAQRGKRVILSGGTALYYKALLEGLFECPPSDMALRNELKSFAEEHGNETLFERLQEKDPAAAAKLHPNDLRRVVRALEIAEITGESISSRQRQWSGFHEENAPFQGELRYRFRMALLDWPREVLADRIALRVERMHEEGILEEARMVYENREKMAHTPLQAVGYKEFFPYFSGEQTLEECNELLRRNTRRLAKSQRTWFRKFPCTPIAMREDMTGENLKTALYEIWNIK